MKAAERDTDASTIFIYPLGGGAGGQRPYAAQRYGSQGAQELALRINRRLRPGGYTIEARIPVAAIGVLTGKSGTLRKIKVTYQNVNEVYQTNWEGLVRLR